MIKDLCKESPKFKAKIVSLVLAGPFDSFSSSIGRVEPVKDGAWLSERKDKEDEAKSKRCE